MNDENLIPISERATSVQREIRSKGGKAKAEKMKEQKTYREMAKAMLSATLTDENMLSELKAFGISETDVKAYTLLGMIKASAGGSHNAFDRLLELTGEKEQNSNKDVISKLDEVIKGIDAIADE